MDLTKDHLIGTFNKAKENGIGYVAVSVQIGSSRPEIIINSLENIDSKLKYYDQTYDKNLNHKFAEGIKIVDCAYGDSFAEIEDELIYI